VKFDRERKIFRTVIVVAGIEGIKYLCANFVISCHDNNFLLLTIIVVIRKSPFFNLQEVG